MSNTITPRQMATIYGLYDPRNGNLRYIGVTEQPLSMRLSNHVAETKQRLLEGKATSRRTRWIADVLAAGFRPEIRPVEVVPNGEGTEAELEWIRYFASEGFDLVNTLGNKNIGPVTQRLQNHPPMRDFLLSVGKAVRKERNRQRLSLRGLAAKCNTSHATIALFEKGHDIQMASFYEICIALNFYPVETGPLAITDQPTEAGG